MFLKLTDGTITRWINMDVVIQMRFDDDKHQTELFLLREHAGPVFVDETRGEHLWTSNSNAEPKRQTGTPGDHWADRMAADNEPFTIGGLIAAIEAAQRTGDNFA
ncbi:hypothetical protein [Rhizobium leguminosarum]|uniref:hypothetical protein n=1 Tax=Rhizobium leguminosarum TaxID=384 RepID=UPI0021BC1847|nr:hypothetical protein [Rhizobium leguminosarum]